MFSGPAAFKLQASCWSGVGSAVPKLAAAFKLPPQLAGGEAAAKERSDLA
ncbi:hypothetical protein SGRA_3644 [Saprospira grandis str. Lewin]|uniref:Uncharacterized protein n=1 Tax=Saprospira grandis (strain Lewin) TaxID=984262 RepID=H6L6T5_SAPGL|nr:hypothetical protein SGRA_3644 [Saprospira grandis str. Lewin]